ncbi:MAG: hypothetical protein ACI3YJ_08065 [Prevotella sp.]
MKKIQPDDNRNDIIRKFDDCMIEFFARTIGFCEEITRIAESDESNRKINTLAYNLLEDLDLITQNAEYYENEIKWSMLDIRLDKNEDYKSKMEKDLIDFKHKVNEIIGNGGIGNNTIESNTNQDTNSESKAIVVSEREAISRQMANISVLIFSQILQRVENFERMFSELGALNVSRTDDDYMKIYICTCKKFESTEEYKAFSDSYIDKTIKYKYNGKLSNPTQIDSLITQRNIDAMYDHDIGKIWISSSDNPIKATKLFVERRLLHDREILKFLHYKAELNLLEEYKLYVNKDVFKIGKGSLQSNKLEFYAPYSDVSLHRQWSAIHKLMDDKGAKAWEWCALHHALSIKRKINNVDFYTFVKWIKKEFKVVIITSSNCKNYKYDYFVITNQEEWNLEKYKDYYLSGQNPKQRGTSFGTTQIKIFNRIYEDIYTPLLKILAN